MKPQHWSLLLPLLHAKAEVGFGCSAPPGNLAFFSFRGLPGGNQMSFSGQRLASDVFSDFSGSQSGIISCIGPSVDVLSGLDIPSRSGRI